jgi:hypothetical protein
MGIGHDGQTPVPVVAANQAVDGVGETVEVEAAGEKDKEADEDDGDDRGGPEVGSEGVDEDEDAAEGETDEGKGGEAKLPRVGSVGDGKDGEEGDGSEQVAPEEAR